MSSEVRGFAAGALSAAAPAPAAICQPPAGRNVGVTFDYM